MLQSLGVERLTVEQAIAVLSQKLVEYDEQGNEVRWVGMCAVVRGLCRRRERAMCQ